MGVERRGWGGVPSITRTCRVAGWKPWCGNSHPTLTSPPLNQPPSPSPGTIVYDYTNFRSMKGAIYFLHLSTNFDPWPKPLLGARATGGGLQYIPIFSRQWKLLPSEWAPNHKLCQLLENTTAANQFSE